MLDLLHSGSHGIHIGLKLLPGEAAMLSARLPYLFTLLSQ